MKKILYLLSSVTIIASGIYIGKNTKNQPYQFRESSHLFNQKHYQSDAPTAIEEAFEYYRLISANQESGIVEQWMVQQATDYIKSKPQRRLNNNMLWEFAGPDNVGGRTRAYLIERGNPRLRFAGGVSGGLYRSTNGGINWSAVNPMAQNLNISCIAQSKDGVIMYGTGEAGFVSVSGTKDGTPGFAHGGVFISEDGGETFTNLSNTLTFGHSNAMASDSLNPARIWVAFNSGLKYTDDKGVTWTNISNTFNCRDVHVTSDGTIFAYNGGSTISRSTDGGTSFQTLTIDYNPPGKTASVVRVRIASSVQDPNYIYLAAAGTIGGISGNNYLVGLYRSTDKGNTFQMIQSGGSPLFNPLSQVLTLQGQGNFDFCLTVDPENKNRAIIGGVQLAEWNNGAAKIIGSLFQSPFNQAYVHADKHELLWDYNTSPPTLIILTDGGMFYSANKGITFTESNRNYTTTQFYGVAANEAGHIVGGTQDNGTLLVNGRGNTKNSSVMVLGGDGFQTEISRLNSNVIFGESQYGNLRRSVNGGVSFAPIWDNRLQGTGAGTSFQFADFNAQFKLWENDTNGTGRLFFCTSDRIWVAIDPLNTTEVPTWFVVADGASGLGGGRFIDIEYSKDGGTLFVCRGSSLYRINGLNLANFDTTALPNPTSKDPLVTVSNISLGLPGGRTITSINLDPNNPNRALITLGNYGNTNYVYLCENILDPVPLYTNITANLPQIPVYDAIISTEDPNYFLLATELGIWGTETAGTVWEEQNEGMARVATYIIRQYKWRPWEGPHIYIGTHGAGYFKSKSILTNVKNVSKYEVKSSLTAYPNPANNFSNIKFNLKTSQANVKVKVIDITGKLVFEQQVGSMPMGENTIKLDISNFKTGNYVVNVSGNGYSETARISVIR